VLADNPINQDSTMRGLCDKISHRDEPVRVRAANSNFAHKSAVSICRPGHVEAQLKAMFDAQYVSRNARLDHGALGKA